MVVEWLGAPRPSDAAARVIIERAFESVFGRAPSLAEAQGAQVIARRESGYGAGWKNDDKCPNNDCEGSNNWGAIIRVPCPKGSEAQPDCPPGSFLHLDHRADRSKCWQCFRRYETPEEGAADLIRQLYTGRRGSVLNAATRGSLYGMMAAMFDTGYYGGFGTTREERIQSYLKGTYSNLKALASNMGERVALTGTSAPSSGRSPWVTLGAAAAAVAAVVTFPTWRGAVGL